MKPYQTSSPNIFFSVILFQDVIAFHLEEQFHLVVDEDGRARLRNLFMSMLRSDDSDDDQEDHNEAGGEY